jgi:hypothetical protein
MWGGLLQDTVSPMGDMAHYLAKASFLQDMLLGMFVCFVFGFVFFLYVIIGVQRVFSLNKPYIHITSLMLLSLSGSQFIDGTILRSKVKVMLW